MATKRLPRPHDPIVLAKLIGDIATGQVVDNMPPERQQPSPPPQKVKKQGTQKRRGS
jgi:hypothetical protein